MAAQTSKPAHGACKGEDSLFVEWEVVGRLQQEVGKDRESKELEGHSYVYASPAGKSPSRPVKEIAVRLMVRRDCMPIRRSCSVSAGGQKQFRRNPSCVAWPP